MLKHCSYFFQGNASFTWLINEWIPLAETIISILTKQQMWFWHDCLLNNDFICSLIWSLVLVMGIIVINGQEQQDDSPVGEAVLLCLVTEGLSHP